MKTRWLLPVLLVAGCLSLGAATIWPLDDAGNRGGFAAFREERLQLPERHESVCPAAVEDIIDIWDVSPEELEELGLTVNSLVGMESQGKKTQSLADFRLVKVRQADLDGDGLEEEYSLKDGIIRVQADSRLIWKSPADWWVDYFFLGDSDNNGRQELNLLVWKEGSFGSCRPFWLEEEDCSIKNHLFIFKLESDRMKPVWQSSNLARPNYRAALLDSDGDGEWELLALEGPYTGRGQLQLTLWQWNGWGFSRLR